MHARRGTGLSGTGMFITSKALGLKVRAALTVCSVCSLHFRYHDKAGEDAGCGIGMFHHQPGPEAQGESGSDRVFSVLFRFPLP